MTTILETKLAELKQQSAKELEEKTKQLIVDEVAAMKAKVIEQHSDLLTTIGIIQQYEPNFQLTSLVPAPLVPNRVYADANVIDALILVLMHDGIGAEVWRSHLIYRVYSDSLKQGWSYASENSVGSNVTQRFAKSNFIQGTNEVTKKYKLYLSGGKFKLFRA